MFIEGAGPKPILGQKAAFEIHDDIRAVLFVDGMRGSHDDQVTSGAFVLAGSFLADGVLRSERSGKQRAHGVGACGAEAREVGIHMLGVAIDTLDQSARQSERDLNTPGSLLLCHA